MNEKQRNDKGAPVASPGSGRRLRPFSRAAQPQRPCQTSTIGRPTIDAARPPPRRSHHSAGSTARHLLFPIQAFARRVRPDRLLVEDGRSRWRQHPTERRCDGLAPAYPCHRAGATLRRRRPAAVSQGQTDSAQRGSSHCVPEVRDERTAVSSGDRHVLSVGLSVKSGTIDSRGAMI